MDGENYVAQLTEAERADAVLQNRAREIIEAREPKIDVRYARVSRKYGVEIAEIADGVQLSRIYFPTRTSRDEGVRRAKRAAMEYSLWRQLYHPVGAAMWEEQTAFVISHDGNRLVECAARSTWMIDEEAFRVYKTEADAQRVADILKREGV